MASFLDFTHAGCCESQTIIQSVKDYVWSVPDTGGLTAVIELPRRSD